jgi:protein-tyrosine kinase
MLIPKASHLIERVAERLLRAGALEDSAVQLMRPPGEDGAITAAEHFPAAASPPPAVSPQAAATPEAPLQGSSAFTPPANAALPASDLSAPPTGAGQLSRNSLFADAPAPPPVIVGLAPGPGGTMGQPEMPRGVADAAALSPPRGSLTDPAAALPKGVDPAAALPKGVDPAAALPLGPSSVDAVSLERAGMVDWSRTRTRISEEFRLVQRQILRSAFGPGAQPGFSNLLLVTSSRPGEGKSFMSTNLAGSIARQGDHHVLLVDADSKRDSICYSLGLAQQRGLLDLAANPKLDPAPLIVRTPIERLSILPVGRERERSAELFSTKEMTRLIQSLGRRYADRLLILDAPPCLSTSDPAILAQVVGQILFVVEADRTQRDEIEASLDLIQACPTITLVLNKQQISSRYTFGAYSSYYSS